MIRFWQNKKGSVWSWLALCLAFSGCVVLAFVVSQLVKATPRNATETTQNALLPRAALWSVMLGRKDVPLESFLLELEVYPSEMPQSVEESWCGPPTGERRTSQYGIDIGVEIAESLQEAVEIVERQRRNISGVLGEVSGQPPFASFSDRVWYGSGGIGARLLFIRGNVVGDVCIVIAHTAGPDQAMLVDLARRLGKKIDAALAGNPEPVPVLPLAACELRIDSSEAWENRNLGQRLWGDEGTSIAVQRGVGLPRELPAKKVTPEDYMVPLRHLVALLAPKERVEVTTDQARVRLMGKMLVFKRGASQVEMDEETVQLSHPVEFKGKHVLVPLSLVEKALDRHIMWEKLGEIPLARIEAKLADAESSKPQ